MSHGWSIILLSVVNRSLFIRSTAHILLKVSRLETSCFPNIKKTKTHTDHVNFRKARNRVLSLMIKKKKNCVIGKLNENIGKPKELWKSLKSLGLPSKQDKPSKICLKTDGEHCFDDKINSNVFNPISPGTFEAVNTWGGWIPPPPCFSRPFLEI